MKSACIMGIETSCDETAVAVVQDGKKILANCVSSQIPIHRRFGGIIPEIASRQHLDTITCIVEEALKQAGLTFNDIDAIAVTAGPGLIGALLVGVASAKAYAYRLGIPLLPVNHLEGHIYANFLTHPELEPPLLCLVVSGGHTSLILIKEHLHYELLGSTRDDAAGEAFDKIARVLGLPYPGGPALEQLALEGKAAIPFPRAWLGKSLDFSFSGLKTAVTYYLKRLQENGEKPPLADIAASFQAAVIDVLVEKTMLAAQRTGIKSIALAGGVAANNCLRQHFQQQAIEKSLSFCFPPIKLCTDNAAMIACVGYYYYLERRFGTLDQEAYANFALVE